MEFLGIFLGAAAVGWLIAPVINDVLGRRRR